MPLLLKLPIRQTGSASPTNQFVHALGQMMIALCYSAAIEFPGQGILFRTGLVLCHKTPVSMNMSQVADDRLLTTCASDWPRSAKVPRHAGWMDRAKMAMAIGDRTAGTQAHMF